MVPAGAAEALRHRESRSGIAERLERHLVRHCAIVLDGLVINLVQLDLGHDPIHEQIITVNIILAEQNRTVVDVFRQAWCLDHNATSGAWRDSRKRGLVELLKRGDVRLQEVGHEGHGFLADDRTNRVGIAIRLDIGRGIVVADIDTGTLLDDSRAAVVRQRNDIASSRVFQSGQNRAGDGSEKHSQVEVRKNQFLLG